MYHQNVATVEAMPIEAGAIERELVAGGLVEPCDPAAAEPRLGDRLMAVVIIAALPFMLIGFLIRFVWSDIMKALRGAMSLTKGVAEDLAQRP